MATVLSGTSHEPTLRHRSRRSPASAAAALLAALVLSGCHEDGKRSQNLSLKLAERIGCSSSYEAVTTEAPGVEAMGKCTFRGYELSLVSFADNAARNDYACSTCGFDADTDSVAVETTGRRFGGFLVVGDGYLVQAPNAAAERAVRDVLG